MLRGKNNTVSGRETLPVRELVSPGNENGDNHHIPDTETHRTLYLLGKNFPRLSSTADITMSRHDAFFLEIVDWRGLLPPPPVSQEI